MASSTPNPRPGSPRRGKVLVAMSGGVDSSVTAALLKREGYEVVGCFMRLGSDDSVEAAEGYDNMFEGACDPTKQPKANRQGCCSVNDASDARLVAAMLDIPFYVLNFKKDFGRIINYFVDEYNAGRTPNPCVRCNDWLKFGKLYDYAQSIDADYIASGHYARIGRALSGGRARLLRGVDHHKDQSYVLFGSPRDRIDHMMLPIGDLEKSAVRQLAEEFDLPVFDKPDSQEICFVPDNDYARLVRRRSPDLVEEGDVLDAEGNKVGRHPGHQHYTIGQRRGLGIALGYPIYVTHRDPQGNTITVGQKDDLLATGCTARDTNWLIDDVPTDWRPCEAKVRYNSQPVSAEVRATPGSGEDVLEVRFTEPVDAVTPGQAVVCYDGDAVMGGGWIDSATR
ncbi:tRNA 2-thiouridine(34) synthase MnmA [Phycisphaerales bacterium AB-hyl4]|uniref:tRNA-specific 2-thiouridylase MnmA n=1 Tax=Natronomicrosphaera hydrolytica TaxID=3242702 RepID=A0ABV4U295_9BACT